MNFTAIAIDDEPFALKDLELQLASLKQLKLKATFNNVLDALDYFADNAPVDLIFLDICMEGIRGLEGATLLSKYCDLILFTTGHPEYALDAFNVGADAYLMKPINRDEVEQKLAKLTKLRTKDVVTKEEAPSVGSGYFVKGTKNITSFVDPQKILLIRSNGNNINFVTRDKTVTAHMSLRKAEERLSETGLFIRINQSIIVSKKAINDLKEDGVVLVNGQWYPIGRSYHKRFQEYCRQLDFKA